MSNLNKENIRPQGELSGNKGANLGNLESKDIHQHIIDNNQRMAQNFDNAKVELSSFKPTENRVKGQEGYDRERILGNDESTRDPFFDTKRNLPSDFQTQGELHGNKGKNLGNLESHQIHQHIVDNNVRMAQNLENAKVELSSFKPTENPIKGQPGNNRENILGNDENSRDPFFDTKRELPSDFKQGDLHGNKGKNLGNLESKDIHQHIIDNNQRMAQNFDNAKVGLSGFKPTENEFKGQPGNNREFILGNDEKSRDPFFDTKRELPADFKEGDLHGNKGKNLGNLESKDVHQHIIDNNQRMAQNFDNAKVNLSSFKPTENQIKGKESNNRENILGNDETTRDPFFDTVRDIPQGRNDLSGNKGANLGNIESQDLKSHLVDNNKKMADNFKSANVGLSNFKPTENEFKGSKLDTSHKSLDTLGNKLLTEADKDFTKSVGGGGDFGGVAQGESHGNKGRNMSNLESNQAHNLIVDNNKRMAENFDNANVELSSFKPTENVFKGHEGGFEKERILGNDPSSRDPFFDTNRERGFQGGKKHFEQNQNVSNVGGNLSGNA